MKYLLIDGMRDGVANVTITDSKRKRETATLLAIFGSSSCGLSPHQKRSARKYLAELKATGLLVFEGDSPIRWIDAPELVIEVG